MAKVVNFLPSMDEDMKDYHKKIWKHRTAVIIKYVTVIVLVLFVIFGIRYYVNNRSYTGCSIASTTERNDTLTTKYAPFGDKILKYSRDGISYTDDKNSLLFSITYTMQDPILALSENAGAVADKNGSQIYIFNREKQLGQITTLLPIKQIAISNQGVAAVLMEESNSSKLEIYSAEGTLIGDGVFDLGDAGYPMNLSISRDGTKIAVAFAQINGSKLNSCVAVYNFDNVGENYVDQLVFAKNYTEYMIPEVHYFDQSVFAAVGDGILAFYQGTQIPELVQEVTFEEEIKSVFYGEDNVGLVFDTAEGKELKLYDMKGNLISEISFDLDYDNIRIADNRILIYNDTEMGLYSYSGKECFRQTFETSMVDIFMTKSRSKYLFIYTNETQLIKLQ
ncbi:MAG: hypothetical protein J6B94_04725 [Lachnospiraceae bacterium]|nr:hypothetical protein [Lachnospiraceae bacterium]